MRKCWITALSLTIATRSHRRGATPGRLGITFQVPAALGFIWHATDKLALRPEFNIATSSGGSTENLMWGVAISAPAYSGSFGAQYAPIKRFNMFGETGYGYTRFSASSPQTTTMTSSSWGLRSHVGMILYFDP